MKRRDFIHALSIGSIAAGTFIPSKLMANAESYSSTGESSRKKNTGDKDPLIENRPFDTMARSGIALGGIGTGYVEIHKDGNFHNWNIFNNVPKGTGPVFYVNNAPYRTGWEEGLQFFAVRYKEEGKDPKIKLLQQPGTISGGATDNYGNIYIFPWMSPVQNIQYSSRFPFSVFRFSDEDMPFEVEMEAFTPFIPHDVKNSSLPAAIFNFRMISKTDKPVEVMLIASQRNLVGYDTNEKYFVSEIEKGDGYIFFNQTAGGMDEKKSSYGQMGMASLSSDSSYYLGWSHLHPYYEQVLRNNRLPDIDDTDGIESIGQNVPEWMPHTAGRNTTDQKTGKKIAHPGMKGEQKCMSSLACSAVLKPGDHFDHSFVMSWHFANQYNSGRADDLIRDGKDGDLINYSNYYTQFFDNANDVARYLVNNKEDLTYRTKEFIVNFYDSDIPLFVLDQINSQLNTFITSGWISKDMMFGIREGMADDRAYAGMYTIDVALYGSVMIAALFPELQKSAMRAHAAQQGPKGQIHHALQVSRPGPVDQSDQQFHRVDMPGNYVQMVMRDYFWTNDRKYLEELWPSIQKAIDYILEERDADHDLMPDMTGIMCSYDNFPMYGLASYILSQWLTTMASAAEGAGILGDKKAEKKYRKVLNKGSKMMDEYLWNGEYYNLSNDYLGEKGIDSGCLTDQMAGQWMAHQSGLGYLMNKDHVKKAMKSILNSCFRQDFGLKNFGNPGTWLVDVEPDRWVDQSNTCWTGVELAFASFLLFEGYYDEALNVVKSVDDRYRKAGLYWNQIECGGHYFRPMSAWAIVNGMLGLQIRCGEYRFAPVIPEENYRMFFAFPDGTAHYIAEGRKVRLKVLTGVLKISKLVLPGAISDNGNAVLTINGTVLTGSKDKEGNLVFTPDGILILDSGQEITVG